MKRNLIKVGITFFLIFTIINAVWFANSYLTYHPFTKTIPKHMSGIYVYNDPTTNYSYNIKFPDYLTFTGNLGVSDNKGSSLIIWPGLFGQNYEFGFLLTDGTKTHYVYVDKNMELLYPSEELSKVFHDYENLMTGLWQGAHNKWDEVWP